MRVKRELRPGRVRRVPAQFSWIDQRLVREGHMERCDVHALALYLLLVTVADAQGLSYYGDGAPERLLSMSKARLHQGRSDLVRLELIAYAPPLYQVLALDPPEPPRTGGVKTLAHRIAQLRDTLTRQRIAGAEPKR
ncbi:MAG: hypothetical protein ABI145_15645 [Steroidobacteraceae bacterium]